MVPVEEAIVEILGLDELQNDPPRAPVVQPGPIDYPRWSNIYYAGPRVGAANERKRYLAISHDQYNRAMGGAICIRTTTSERRGGRTIPTLSDRVTKAVCVLPTFWSTHSASIRETPPPPNAAVPTRYEDCRDGHPRGARTASATVTPHAVGTAASSAQLHAT